MLRHPTAGRGTGAYRGPSAQADECQEKGLRNRDRLRSPVNWRESIRIELTGP